MSNDHIDERDESSPGLFGSIRRLIDRFLAILHNRFELLTTELEEEVSRLVGVVLWAFVALFCAMVGLAFVGVTIVLAIPPAYRVWTAGGFALLFLVVALIGTSFVRSIMRSKPRLFDASLRELEKDREHLRSGR